MIDGKPMNLRPLTISDILDYSFDMLIEKFFSFLALSLILQLPSLAVLYALVRLVQRAHARHNLPESAAALPLLLSVWVLFLLTKAFISYLTSETVQGKQVTAAGLTGPGLSRLLPVTGFAFIAIAAYTLLFSLPFSLLAYAATSHTGLNKTMLALGAVSAFSLSAVLSFIVRTSLVLPFVVIEQYSLVTALRKAVELTRPPRFDIMLVLILANAAVFIPASLLLFTAWWAVPFYLIIILPLVSIVETLLFYDRMIRREAYDLFIKARLMLKRPEILQGGEEI